MVKFRNAHYCNVKLFLIFLVIYGHLIEPWIYRFNVLLQQYRLIYFFHMPLFIFLSGLFINNERECRIAIRKVFPLYAASQVLAVLLGRGEVKFLTPYWHLWYLLSYCCWLGLVYLWFKFCNDRRKIFIFAGIVVLGCLAGYLPFINRMLSLSRTLVFFPYFFAGVLMKPTFSWGKYRKFGWIALGMAILIVFGQGRRIPVTFLYQAEAFRGMENGAVMRFLCYLIGAMFSFGILTVMPARRFPFTKAGADTMPAYLFHVLIVLYLREWTFSWQIYFIISVVFLYVMSSIMCWYGKLYGIVPGERRDSRCRVFKKYTKNMRNQYIDSCCP